MTFEDPIQMVPKIAKWAKKGPQKIRKYANGANHSGRSRKITVAKLLVEQAATFGYYNGKRIGRRK